jgi:hypothetical protein
MCLAINFNSNSFASEQFNHRFNHHWELISTNEDIHVFEDLNNKKDIILLKAETEIQAPLKVVLSVLANAPKKAEWMPNYGGSKTVKGNAPLNRIEYSISKVPSPFKDRDFVFKIDSIVDKKNKSITVKIKSVNDVVPVDDRYVRGELIHGTIYIEHVKESVTFVRIIFATDPKGLIPTWLVNYASRKWPFKMIKGLRMQVKKLLPKKEFYLSEINLWE